MPVTEITDLPDAAGLQLDGSIEDELTAEWSGVLNNGSYRLEVRDDDPEGNHPPYEAEALVGYETLSHVITGLRDGEQYSVRLRTETDYRTGAWLTADEITKFPAPDGLTLTPGVTSVDLAWNEYADNELGSRIFRAREYDSGWSQRQAVGENGPDETTYTDDTALPSATYEYTVREYTDWVYADTEPVQATTQASGFEGTRTGSRGWYVEIDHPSGRTLTPQILDDPRYTPQVNDLPRIELPVERSETWQAPAFEDAPLRVWKDGMRLPIDRLEHARLTPEHTVLEGRGGTDLLTRVQEEVDTQQAHAVAEDLITTNTPYVANIDNPMAETREGTLLQSASDDADFLSLVEASIPDTTPLAVHHDGLEVLQSCFVFEGESAYGTTNSSDAYSDGQALMLGDVTTDGRYTFSTEYTIPNGEVVVAYRIDVPTEYENPPFDIILDGQTIESYTADALLGGLRWNIVGNYDGALPAGSHTIEFDTTNTGSNEIYLDVVAAFDDRYSYDFDNEVHAAGGYLDGPQRYPDLVRQEMTEATSPVAIAAADIDIESNDPNGIAEIGLTPDGGGTYDTATDTLTHSITPTELTDRIGVRFGLGRFGSGGEHTPRTGFRPQRVDSYGLRGDLDDTPLLTNRTFDGQLIGVLAEIADYGNFVFEIRPESDGNGGTSTNTSIEWTRIGGRTSTSTSTSEHSDSEPLADYEFDKQTEDTVERAIIYGSSQRVVRQSFTAAHGEWVVLGAERLVEGKESVYDPDTDASFAEGEDYEIRYQTGEIRTLSSGTMSDSASYRIDYDFRTKGEFTSPDVADGTEPKTIVETFAELTTDQACEQTALYIVQEASEPITEATVTVPSDQVGWSVIETIDPDALPTPGSGAGLQIRGVDTRPAETVVRLASRQSVSEVIGNIRSRIRSVSRRV